MPRSHLPSSMMHSRRRLRTSTRKIAPGTSTYKVRRRRSAATRRASCGCQWALACLPSSSTTAHNSCCEAHYVHLHRLPLAAGRQRRAGLTTGPLPTKATPTRAPGDENRAAPPPANPQRSGEMGNARCDAICAFLCILFLPPTWRRSPAPLSRSARAPLAAAPNDRSVGRPSV